DASLALTEAAIALAQDEFPGLDTQGVLTEIDALADKLRRRLAPDAGALQKLRLLNRYFFDELGFAGNVNDYYDPHNSYLHRVLATRRGIPVSLAVLYMELASQIGLSARGVGFPGHFLVKLKLHAAGEVMMDPFSGLSLSREQLDERLAPYRRRQARSGEEELPLAIFLQPATPRDVLARMLRNLKEIHRSTGNWPALLGVLQRLVVLLPDDMGERRDRGLVLAELGRYSEAAQDLDAYLARRPSAPDGAALKLRAEQLRAQGRPRLH
ncbi:MAG TPA: transglutaminase-like domain-containing protein, partial [Methylibium sp.]